MPLSDESVDDGSQAQCGMCVLRMVLAALSAGFGLLALLGWIARVPVLATFATGKIPMAPSTALLLLLFGTAVFLRAYMPQSPGARRTGLAFGLSGTLVALLLLALSLLGVHPAAEHLGIQIAGMVDGAKIGHMSPLTASCFVLCAFSLLVSFRSSPGRRWRAGAASFCASLVTLTSAAVLLGYLVGAPVLYGSGFIPPALTTSLALLMLGAALMLSSIDWGWLNVGRSDAASNRTARRLILVFIVASACILTAGHLYFHSYELSFGAEVAKQLSVIGKLKADELTDWRQERLGDAGLFYKNAGFAALVRRYLDAPEDASAEEQLHTWLSRVASHSDCDRVSLLDARGTERMSVPAKSEAMDIRIVRGVAEVLRSGQVDFLDFYRCEHDKRIYLAILVPIFTERQSRRVGVLALCIDPHKSLYPYISSWPTTSRTAETLIVRRDGNDAVFLNELRFRKNTALKTRIALDKKDAPAVKAVLGHEGIVEGVDYRGMPVIAALRAVPDSPWFLVARMDTSEVYAPLRKRLWEVVGLVGALLIGTGASLGLLWRQQSVRFYREQSQSAEALRESEENISTTLRSIGDAVVSTDMNGRVVRMNPVAEEFTGWVLSEAIGRPISEVINIINALTGEPAPIPVDEVLSTGEVCHLSNHTTLISRDGTQRQIADSAAPIRDDRGAITGVVLVFSDMSEQYRIREALRESEDKFRGLFESSRDAVMTLEPPSWKFTSCNRATVEVFGAKDVEEFTSLGPWEVSPELQPDGRASGDKAKEMIETAMRDGSHFFEWMHTRISGEEFPCTVLLSRMEQGGRVFLQATVRDVTSQKRAEEALRASLQITEGVINTIPVRVFWKDRNLVYLGCNAAFAQDAGFADPKDVIGKNDYQMGWRDQAELYRGDDLQTIESGESKILFEEPQTTPEGNTITLLTSKIPLRHSNGEICGVLGTYIDVTERKRVEEALQTERDNLAAAFRSSPVGMLLLDEQMMIIDANSVIASMVSRSPGEIISQRGGGGLGCVHSLEDERGCGFSSVCGDCSLRQGLTQVLVHGTSIRGAEIQTTLLIGGQERRPWLRVSAEPVTINGRKHAIVAIDDITEHKLLSEELEAAATQVKGLMTQVVTGNSFTGRFENPGLSRCWEEKKCTKTECPSYKNFGNLRCWEVAGTFCGDEVQGVFAQKYGDCSLCTVYRSARGNSIMELGETFNTMAAILENRREALVQAKAETEVANRQLVSALTQANELASQMEQAKDQIEGNAAELGHQANHDALTGLPNRRYFEQHLHDLITGGAGRKSRSMAVLFLDLDKFKLINDTLGHKLGDLLLVEVAKRLQSCLRSGDVLARMGGDEFTVILSRCQSRSVAGSVAARMIDSIGRQFEIQGHKFVIGVSIGVARHPSDAADAGTLIKYADAAMYKAKESGRNNCQFFSEEISQANEARAETERDLRLAVERDDLEVYYQPIVDVRTMRIAGAEALLRWNHPDKGMISPGLFMPVAEETGLIVQVGRMVLSAACKQCASWLESGYTDLGISVNVSPIQLRDMVFASEVDSALCQAGLPPRCLRLEVIETALGRTDNDELGVLRCLRVLGVSICIDDFGIGYSSLSRLNNLPIDHLKIDGHFIRNIESNKKDRAMAESIIVMAHNLGMQVTAEWVEDDAQMETIRSLGCDYAQGYLISPALSSQAFGDFIREWTLAQRAADAA